MSFEDDYRKAREAYEERERQVDAERRKIKEAGNTAVAEFEKVVITPFLDAVKDNQSAFRVGYPITHPRFLPLFVALFLLSPALSNKTVGHMWEVSVPGGYSLVIERSGAWMLKDKSSRSIIERHGKHGPRWHQRNIDVIALAEVAQKAVIKFMVQNKIEA